MSIRAGFLGRLRIARKLNLILALGTLAVAAVVGAALYAEREGMIRSHIEATQHLVESAQSVTAMYYDKGKSGELTDEAARAQAMSSLKAMRYGGDNYFWINDMQARMVMHPFKPELVGKDLSGMADPNGVKIFIEAVQRAKSPDGGFIDYSWPKPGEQAPVRKISYVKGFQPWGWVIGSGIYLDDINAALRTRAIELGALGASIILLMWILSHMIARAIVKPLRQAVNFAEDIAKGDLENWIEAPDSRDESAQLIRALGSMQTQLKQQIGDMERVLAENGFIREALDNLDTMVRIADYDGKVVFANRALLRMLKQLEPAIQKFRPEFRAENFIGGNIGDIYPDAAAAVARMRSVNVTMRTRAPSYDRIIDFVYSPIFDANQKQCGTIAEWVEVTSQVNVENELIALIDGAATGDFSHRIDVAGKEGVLLTMAKGFNQLLTVVESTLTEVGRVLGALSEGDLRETIKGEFHGMLGKLRDDTNLTVEQLRLIISQIKLATENINTAAREISSGNSDLADRTGQQAASLEQTSASMDKLTATVRQNADSASQANQLAIGATDVAQRGGKVVSEVMQTMDTISESSRKIVDIISVIDGIAFQTNILALNAAVEAARAGEQGRGFAVVASEVRNLAHRSADAAKEIKSLIGDSVEKVGTGAKLVRSAGETMNEIVSSIKRVSDIMGEISQASQEQSVGIEDVNTSVAKMDESTQQNAALVEEASAAAHSLTDQAEALSDAVSKFKLEINQPTSFVSTQQSVAA